MEETKSLVVDRCVFCGDEQSHYEHEYVVGVTRYQCPGTDEILGFVGTCQSCGAYWDVRQRKVCVCGGEVL